MLHKADISVLYFAFFWLSFANARGKVIFNLELLKPAGNKEQRSSHVTYVEQS